MSRRIVVGAPTPPRGNLRAALALAGGLAVLLADVVEVGWFSVRHWDGVTLAVEFGLQNRRNLWVGLAQWKVERRRHEGS